MRKDNKFSLEPNTLTEEEELEARKVAIRERANILSGVVCIDKHEQGVLYENPSGQGRPGKYPWGAMEIGDSVAILPEHLGEGKDGGPTKALRANVNVRNSKFRPKRWAVGRTKDKEWRIWRTQ